VASALYTIGYEGLELDLFLAMLKAERIDRLIDIRELPLSRKRGFSRTPLGDALSTVGIEYVHLRAAGNPFRKDDDAIAKYRLYLSKEIVDAATEVVRGHRAALLCYEHDPGTCHRSVLAPRVARRLEIRPVNL
jgi:uncharacterized protein (DUF488 family)